MSSKNSSAWMTLLCLIAVLLSLVPALPVQAAPPAQEARPADTTPPGTDIVRDRFGLITLTLRADGPVAPGGDATLTVEATVNTAVPAITFDWFLPDGGELLGGPAQEISGAAQKGETRRNVRQVRFPADGLFRVMAAATIQPNEASTFNPAGVLFFTVRSDGTAAVDDKNPNPADPRATPMEATVVSSEAGPVAPSGDVVPASPDDPCFTVKGRVTRQELRSDSNGFFRILPDPPVAHAVIEVREEDTLFDDSYGTMLTGADGRYSFAFCDDDGLFDDELEIYVRLRAEIKDNSFTVVEVTDSSYIDEVYEFDSGIIETEGGTHTIDFVLDEGKSGIFNIADAIWNAWSFWNESGGAVNDDAYFSESAEAHWEPGYGDDISYYSSTTGEITVADDPSDPDLWDDSVIMHEWGHMADDEYGCDDNGGGEHSVDQRLDDPELAWGEAYPDYFQSAVRQARGYTDAQWYLDRNGAGMIGRVNLETFDSTRTDDLLSDRHEFAIAAMLWDLNDSQQDGRSRGGGTTTAPFDRVSYGHTTLQRLYTHPTFESNGDIFDDTCTSFVYLDAWRKIGLPTDGPTAEAVTKNINRANPFNVPGGGLAAADAQPAAALAAPSGAEDYQWWQRLTMVVDNSASMAGQKLDGVKVVTKEQANDLAADPKGAQFNLYTFNNTSLNIAPAFRNYFTAPDAAQGIDALVAGGAADPSCQTFGLNSLAQAARTMRGGQAWLYTDGDSFVPPSAAGMKQLLNDRGVRGSVVLLGGCGTGGGSMPNRSNALMAYMGNAANASQPTGIVPYLLTALGSGGQFFYVNKDQLANAGDVLRAQLGHTAGAGRWSDYVSDDWTYLWDKLDPPDYQWFPLDFSQPVDQILTYLDVQIPSSFQFYGGTRSVARVYKEGSIRFNPCTGGPGTICNFLPKGYLYPLGSNLLWNYIQPPPNLAATESAPAIPLDDLVTAYAPPSADEVNVPASPDACGVNASRDQVKLYTGNLGINEWLILTVYGQANTGQCRAYQVWLNQQTGKIIYQYELVTNEAATAEIAIRQTYSFVGSEPDEVIVSNNDIAGASNGMGYVFTPAPPQPTRVHTVTVDALMESVGFLQTGFSGNFEPMIVRDPNGTAVDCNDTANVICLTVDNTLGDRSVQYVQANVNGNTGVWSAVIDAGTSRKATYSFTGMAASEIEVEGAYDHQRASFKAGPLLVKLAKVDGNQLTGWMQTVDGKRWGNEFTLFDDGAHGDGQPGDGQFGLLDFQGPGRGVGYLWVRGTINGEAFQRMDPAPINFQPFELRSLQIPVLPNNGDPVNLYFSFENRDSVQRCFIPTITVPDGWSVVWNPGNGYPCVAPGGTVNDFITVYPDWNTIGAADAGEATAVRSGSRAVIAMSAQDSWNDAISDSAETQLQLYLPPASVVIEEENLGGYLRANGTDTAPVCVRVYDEQGTSVADGTQVDLTTDIGSLAQSPIYTTLGRACTTFTSPTDAGDALVTAVSNGYDDTAIIAIRTPIASQITLTASPVNLGNGATSQLTATVLDAWGAPVPGVSVRIGVDGDGQMGQVPGGEAMVGISNALGQVKTTFTRVNRAVGVVPVRAELLKTSVGGDDVAQSATLLLNLGGMRYQYLPVIQK